MNRIEKGKSGLIGLGIISLVLAVLSVGGGIWLIVWASNNLALGVTAGNIIGLTGGIVLVLLGLLIVYFGIHFVWLGGAIKATKGSIADDNEAIGTINMQKCPNCGSEVSPEDKVCGNCGSSLSKTIYCPKCGEEISATKKFCPKCGEKL